jgi:hypothetical protein
LCNIYLMGRCWSGTPSGESGGGTEERGLFDNNDEEPFNIPLILTWKKRKRRKTSIPRDIALRMFDADYANYINRKQLRSDELSSLYGLLKKIIIGESVNRITLELLCQQAHFSLSTVRIIKIGLISSNNEEERGRGMDGGEE